MPQIEPLHISENGLFMLLDRIDVSKLSGPDKLSGILLPYLAKEITPVVHYIFTQSLCTPSKAFLSRHIRVLEENTAYNLDRFAIQLASMDSRFP